MDLYQELILEHSKRPQHAGLREPFGAESHHVNTSCGDEITLRVEVDGDSEDAVIKDVSYDSIGCSISVASASMLADNLIGQTLAEAQQAYGATRTMLTSKGQDAGDEEVIGDAVALAGVSKYPARVKCALLSWSALQDSLGKLGLDLTADNAAAPRHSGDGEEGMTDTDIASADIEDVQEALRDVVDPELGINVVDLGLVYGVTVDDTRHAVIDMTLTSAACPLTDVIEEQVTGALVDVVTGHTLNWVWMPPWGPDKITDDGREQLRALGFNI